MAKTRAKRTKSSPAEQPARGAAPEAAGGEVAAAPTTADDDIAAVIGANLRRLRSARRLSLQALARASGVSRAMLWQIELGRSAPTIGVTWKIVRALDVPFSALLATRAEEPLQVLRANRSKWLTNQERSFASRALFPFDAPRQFEFYEVRLAPLAVEHADAHLPGTMESLIVAVGRVEVATGAGRHTLEPGDALTFQADRPHVYRNRSGLEAVMYMVMTYAEIVG